MNKYTYYDTKTKEVFIIEQKCDTIEDSFILKYFDLDQNTYYSSTIKYDNKFFKIEDKDKEFLDNLKNVIIIDKDHIKKLSESDIYMFSEMLDLVGCKIKDDDLVDNKYYKEVYLGKKMPLYKTPYPIFGLTFYGATTYICPFQYVDQEKKGRNNYKVMKAFNENNSLIIYYLKKVFRILAIPFSMALTPIILLITLLALKNMS